MALVCHVDKADEMMARARENTPFCDFSISSFRLRDPCADRRGRQLCIVQYHLDDLVGR